MQTNITAQEIGNIIMNIPNWIFNIMYEDMASIRQKQKKKNYKVQNKQELQGD